MKNTFLSLAIIVVAGTTGQMTSCEDQTEKSLPADPVEINLSLKQRKVVASANRFGFDLFRPVVAGEETGTNIMISPFSVTSALSMTLNGASGETFNAVRSALRYDGQSLEEVNETYRRLVTEMVPVDERVVMEIANSVWAENNFRVKKEFMDALKEWYLAAAWRTSVALRYSMPSSSKASRPLAKTSSVVPSKNRFVKSPPMPVAKVRSSLSMSRTSKARWDSTLPPRNTRT